MTDDACRGKLPGAGPPHGGARAGPGGQSPVLEQEFDDGSLYALRAAVAAHVSRAGLSEGRTGGDAAQIDLDTLRQQIAAALQDGSDALLGDLARLAISAQLAQLILVEPVAVPAAA